MKHTTRLGLCTALIAALPLIAVAAPTMNAQDKTFVTEAAQSGKAEVQLAGLALQKSTNPSVDSFAREMRTDHGKANTQLASIATAQGITLPAGVGAKNRALAQKLSNLSGAAFDTTYLDSQLPAHRQALALFRAEAANGSNTALVAFAKQTIPVIAKHIAMDRRDIARVGRTVGMSGSH